MMSDVMMYDFTSPRPPSEPVVRAGSPKEWELSLLPIPNSKLLIPSTSQPVN